MSTKQKGNEMNIRTISPEQESLELHIHKQIDERNVNVLLDYAAFAEDAIPHDLIRNLLFGILMTDERQRRFALAEVATHNRAMSSALKDIIEAMDRQRAAFTENAALALLAETKGGNA